MAETKIKINRAPVLTLWAAVVAERLGYERQTALSLGKALAGLNAQTKGKSLGIYSTPEEAGPEQAGKAQRTPQVTMIPLLGRPIPAVQTEAGMRAAIKGEQVDSEPVQRYLEKKFGEHLDEVWRTMAALAESYDQKTLAAEAYQLYEEFRPSIPKGKRGWGAAGDLDLEQMKRLSAH
jgi:hypothetical protein